MSPPLRVLIIGAGLGGLCLAQGLHTSGIRVAVYERDATTADRPQGYRVHLDARGIDPLRKCLPAALYELFEATRGQPSTGVTRFSVEGTSLKELQTTRFPDAGGAALAQAGWALDRLTLRETLLAGLDGLVHFDKEFTRYELLPTGEVRAQFADGSTATGDLLVGADGVSSRVRQQLLPEATLVDTGIRWLGGKTLLGERIRAVLPDELSDRAVSVLDRGKGIFLAQVLFQHAPDEAAHQLWPGLRFTHNQDYLMWAFVGPADRLPTPEQELAVMTATQLHHVALQATASGHPMLDAVVRAAQPDKSFFLGIRATTPVEDWPAGPVTLLGDAIHAGPVNGNGANSALRDADVLRRNLASVAQARAELLRAVDDYQREMLRNAQAVRQATQDHVSRIAGRPPGRLGIS